MADKNPHKNSESNGTSVALPDRKAQKYNPGTVTSWGLIPRILVFLLYKIFRRVYGLLQKHVIWHLTGTHQQYLESLLPENYSRSAHVLNIIGRYKFDEVLKPATENDFVCTHQSFDHPERVLKDNVTLYVADEKRAIFAEFEEGVQVWRREYGSFFLPAQLTLARRLVVLPWYAFDKISNQVGDPKSNLIYIWNTARCGGTLVGQLFEATGNCVVYNEPNPIVASVKKLPTRETERVIVNIVRMLCKPVTNPKEVAAFVFKPLPRCIADAGYYMRIFPQSRHLFAYRDPIKTASSLLRISYKFPLLRVRSIRATTSTRLYQLLTGKLNPLKKTEHRLQVVQGLTYGLQMWCLVVKIYLRYQKEKARMVGVFYEDLVADRRYAVTQVFQHCGLPDDLIDIGLLAMDVDSQANSVISKGGLRNVKALEFTPEAREECKKLCDSYGAPRVDENNVLEGTITHKWK